jgi:excisionase family DNA binding protein
MGIMSFIRGQLIEIIEWTDDSRDTISFRFEDNDAEIKRGAQLIVRESQVAQFVYLGEFGDTFGPGKHSLTTDNIPILTTLKSWKYGFESPFKADVYFVTTRLFTGNKWGTSNPIMMRDQDFGIVRVRAFGTYDFRVSDPKLMLKEVAGSDRNFRLDEFTETMRSRIVSIFSDALASAKIPVLDVATRYQEVGEALLPLINPIIQAKYGVELASFILENVSVPAEVEQAIDKRSGMAAVGNLNDYVKFQMAQGMEKGGSAGGVATEMAVGLAMAQQIMQQQNSLQSTAPSGTPGVTVAGGVGPGPSGAATQSGSTAPATTLPELLSPAQAAEALGVSEADVMQSLEKGDLKGKKIGSTYRIKRAALDEFLQS